MLATFALAGCMAALRLAQGPPRFDHAAHAKRDLACTDCHDGATSKERAGMPAPAVCADCHDPKGDSPEIARAVDEYSQAQKAPHAYPTLAVRGPTYADVKFSHESHAKAKVDCAKCHDGAARGVLPNPGGPLRMDACTSCHDERKAKNDCATCHERLGKDSAPPSHGAVAAWKMQHGGLSRMADRDNVAERCDVCHTRSDCDSCHAANAPKDHTNAWRTTTHGLSASMDRSRCTACHQSDSCDRCHSDVRPRSHRAAFGGSQARHCVSCHEPVSQQGCIACHKGTPSHATAPPKPLGHDPSSNCRQCHVQGSVTMPHVDNGSSCNACHQ